MSTTAADPPTDAPATLAKVDESFAAAVGAARAGAPQQAAPPPGAPTMQTQVAKPAGKFQVPGAPRKPHGDIAKSMVWIYGEPKIGKTTLMSGFPGLMVIATEKGQDWVTVREPILIESWEHFLEWCVWMHTDRPRKFADGDDIRCIGIDTIDGLFKYCFDSVCASMGVNDPGEIPHGGGWGRLDKEFSRVMSKVRTWPFGMVAISHARVKEFATKGRKVNRNEPNIGAAGFRWCAQAADLILYCHSEDYAEIDPKTGQPTGQIGERRQMLCHPTAAAVGGGRMSSILPKVLPLSFTALAQYFPGTALMQDDTSNAVLAPAEGGEG